MYPHHVFDLEPAGTFGMYPICYQRVSGRYFQPEPAMYSRCFHWFPGPLAPSVMSPRSQPVVREIVGRDRSPKVAALMIGCWSRDIWTSALSEIGQGELMGIIHYTQIPFILVAISQSHLSPLSTPYQPTHS